MRDDGPRQPHRAHQVQPDSGPPLFVADLHEWPGRGPPGVVYENIDPPEPLRRGADESVYVLGVADVGLHRQHVTADVRGRGFQSLFAARADGDAGPFFDKQLRHRFPKATAGGRHERSLASQAQIHPPALPRPWWLRHASKRSAWCMATCLSRRSWSPRTVRPAL